MQLSVRGKRPTAKHEMALCPDKYTGVLSGAETQYLRSLIKAGRGSNFVNRMQSTGNRNPHPFEPRVLINERLGPSAAATLLADYESSSRIFPIHPTLLQDAVPMEGQAVP